MIILTLTGIEAVTQQLQRLVTAPIPPLREALRTEGNQIIRVANTLVPVDTGLLRSTGHVETPTQEGTMVSVALGYGQGLAPYAARIEFDVTLNHPHGGQSHYLQGALFPAAQGFTQRIAEAIRGSLTNS
jgi:hypothetical protein